LLVPTGTQSGIVDQIAEATRAALAEPGYRQMLIDAGMEPARDTSPEEFRRALAADIALWTPIVKALELKLD
jgi:tripartite-type tricarboxylate transporter receptor subunit TctC